MIIPLAHALKQQERTHTWVLNTVSLAHPADTYSLFPLDEKDRWTSPSRIAHDEEAAVIIECVPDTWQIRHFHLPRALAAASITAILTKPWQFKMIPTAMRELRARGVITSLDIYQRIRAEITNADHHLYGHVILDFDEVPVAYDPDPARPIYYEYHLVPGLPALEQCKKLSRIQEPTFHPSEAVTHLEEGGTIIFSDIQDPARFVPVTFPFQCDRIEMICGCDRPSFRPRYV